MTVCNHHDTLAQLRPGQAMVAWLWYQSWRHVAFVQHSRRGLAGAVQVALQKAAGMRAHARQRRFLLSAGSPGVCFAKRQARDGRHESGNGRSVGGAAGARPHRQRHDGCRPGGVARAGRELPIEGTACGGDRTHPAALARAVLSVGGAARGRLVRRARSGRHADRRGARRPTARCAPSATPAGIAACRWRAARAARAPSSAAITAGPTISTAGCVTSRTRTASRASTRTRIRWFR